MIDKKQLIEELLECVKDATDTETKITGLSMCAMLMNEVLDEALTIPVVVRQSEQLCQHKYQDIRYGTSRCVICGEEEQSFQAQLRTMDKAMRSCELTKIKL